MSSPIKVGFVGLSSTGWASIALAPALLQPGLSSSFTLTAVSTSSAASASASAKKYSDQVGHPVKPYHGDTSQIANDPDVDLVAVAIKAPLHKAALLPAIEAGKDVFVEWPAGVGLRESIEIAEAAEKKGIKTMVGLQGRHSPVVKKAKEIIDSGKIGKILSSSIIALAPRELFVWGPQIKDSSSYTADSTRGATMLDIAIGHQMDVFTHVLGDFASVSATTAIQYQTATLFDAEYKPTGKTVPISAPNQVAFTGLLKSGAVSSNIWRGGLPSTQGRKHFLWEIDGEEGSIRLEGDQVASAFVNVRDPVLYLNGELVEVENTSGPADNLAAAWAAFAKGGDYATMEDAVRNHRLLDAITRSAEEGKTISLV
jgi:predicted dehydrogenase